MKKIGNYLYDEAGICPACGRIMRSVRYYEGEKDTTVNMGTSGRYTHYSTSYKNIKEKLAGYCENCDRNAFNAKEENWPKPGIGNWIAMAVSVALALGGAAITVNQFKQLEAGGMNTSLATVGTLGALGGIALFIAFLRSYLSDVKVYKWHQAGNRHTFQPPTENKLSCDVVKYYQLGPYADFRYFDLGYIRMMNGTYFSS